MPTLTPEVNSFVTWLRDNAAALVLVSVFLLLVYRGARPLIHRVLLRVVAAQRLAAGDEPAHELEIARRVETIEDLLNKGVRLILVAAVVTLVLGIFDLWPLLAGLGLVIAAIAFAGQAVILDLIMGILILVEGQYFKGDIVSVNMIEGTVEEVGLRRTVIRDARGTLHSISNGLIRSSSNLSRTFAIATVDIDGVADRDVDAVIEVFNAVGQEMASDEELGPLLQDAPAYSSTIRLSSSGSTLRFAGRVRPEMRARVEAEMRRRVATGLAARDIQLIRSGPWQPPA
jgi:moderate conductance mechanosensitive channel